MPMESASHEVLWYHHTNNSTKHDELTRMGPPRVGFLRTYDLIAGRASERAQHVRYLDMFVYQQVTRHGVIEGIE